MSERFWIILHTQYDVEVEKDHLKNRLDKEVRVDTNGVKSLLPSVMPLRHNWHTVCANLDASPFRGRRDFTKETTLKVRLLVRSKAKPVKSVKMDVFAYA
jgi:hypothetical protein